MNFEEWKKEFSKKADAVIKLHEELYSLIESSKEDMVGLNKDEFVLFCEEVSKRIEKAIEAL
jgi:hypothetical protein